MKSLRLTTTGRACFIALMISFLLSACAHKREKNAQASALPMFIGEVELVNAPGHFVLIDTGASGSLPTVGAEVVARDANGAQTARLKISPQANGSFVSADIVSGKPNRGDRVYR